ncbi:MAG: tRNA lysidine(34) synthetase TilS, partial [Phycisphaerae bacterium]
MLDFITAERLIPKDSKVLLAVSGGADSIALLYVLHNLVCQKKLSASLVCAHINHQLRAEQSDADEKFVIEQAEGLGIEVITKKINVTAIAHSSKLSIETAARQLRIESLIDIAHQAGCGLIAAGHQKNDNAETIIHRILRGTG